MYAKKGGWFPIRPPCGTGVMPLPAHLCSDADNAALENGRRTQVGRGAKLGGGHGRVVVRVERVEQVQLRTDAERTKLERVAHREVHLGDTRGVLGFRSDERDVNGCEAAR